MIQFDGKPLPSGTVTFIATDNGTTSQQAKINDGMYQAMVPVGEKRVEIHASRIIGKPPPEHEIPEKKQYIPARYNQKSELRARVQEGSQLQLNFDLTSDPAS